MNTIDTVPRDTLAPDLEVAGWLNTNAPITLSDLRGKVVLVEAFQMLCPGCVAHALPLAAKVAATFPAEDVAVLGLHTVFEHHDAQGRRSALEAFLHEYRIDFPVAIDQPSEDGPVPRTMATYQLRGTPTTILLDKQGRVRQRKFGRVDELVLGAEIAYLVGEDNRAAAEPSDCTADGCAIG